MGRERILSLTDRERRAIPVGTTENERNDYEHDHTESCRLFK